MDAGGVSRVIILFKIPCAAVAIIEPLNLRALTLHCGEPYETLNILGLRHPGISQSGLEKVSTSRISHLIHLSKQIGIVHSSLARRATLLDVVCLYLVGADIRNVKDVSNHCKYCGEIREEQHSDMEPGWRFFPGPPGLCR